MAPPAARRTPFEHVESGPAPYRWMADGGDDLLAHLESERAYYDAATAHLGPRAEQLRSEMAARVPAEEMSPRWQRPRHWYAGHTPAGAEYANIVRSPGPDTDVRTILDVVAL